jgi:nucleoside-diphosphate-sugar epimerase
MKHAFVTGGSGFVGRRLIEKLIARGVMITALARSDAAARMVTGLGANPCPGGLDNVAAMTEGMRGCDTVFHVAGHLSEWDPYKAFHDANVIGTRNVVQAASAAGIATLAAVGAAAVVMAGPQPMRGISEDTPLQRPSWAPYIATKAEAERIVCEANRDGFKTVVVRPPFIWGAGMPMLDEIIAAVKSGQFALPDGGGQMMSTSHVDNVVECLVLAAERGRGGQAYFVADGDTSTLKDLATALLATRGMPPVKRTAPFALAWRMAGLMEGAWRLFHVRSKSPVTRQTLRMIGQDFTVHTSKAHRDLGYAPIISRAEGLARMRSPVPPREATSAVPAPIFR